MSCAVRLMFTLETGLHFWSGLLTVVIYSKEIKMGPAIVEFSDCLGG